MSLRKIVGKPDSWLKRRECLKCEKMFVVWEIGADQLLKESEAGISRDPSDPSKVES